MRAFPAVVCSLLSLAVVCGSGCRSLYYAAYEKVGIEKRHLLRKNVEKVQEEQSEASEQFKDALTQIKELYAFQGGDLEAFYKKLSSEYEGCESRAERVRERIDTVQRIAKDMFAEWEAEIEEIHTVSLRTRSETALRDTKRRFAALDAAMGQAEERMEPVLQRLKEYVLTLKHELNAKAIGALQGEADSIEDEVLRLLKDMNRSIQEAETFLQDFE